MQFICAFHNVSDKIDIIAPTAKKEKIIEQRIRFYMVYPILNVFLFIHYQKTINQGLIKFF